MPALALMILDITWEENSVEEGERAPFLTALQTGIEAALKAGEGPETGEISLTLVDDQTIRELNRDYRDKDYATDVLSFAMLESEEEEPDIFGLDQNDQAEMLGDIIISVERARSQAEEYGHSLARELVYLAVHGTLHLLGFDHEDDDERREMREKEEEVMTGLGLTRDSIGDSV